MPLAPFLCLGNGSTWGTPWECPGMTSVKSAVVRQSCATRARASLQARRKSSKCNCLRSILAGNEWWWDSSRFWQYYLRHVYTYIYICTYSLSWGYCWDRWQPFEDRPDDWRRAWRFQTPRPADFLSEKTFSPDSWLFLPWSCLLVTSFSTRHVMQTLSHVNAKNPQTILIKHVQHFTSLDSWTVQPRNSPFGTDCPKYRLLSADAVRC